MATTLRAAWSSAALLSLAFVAACSGNDVLGPPDGTACTVGSIAPGDSVKGEVTGSSCVMWSDMNYENVWAQSWTLQAKKNTAYVVRLRHVQNAAAADNWKGDLYSYARNAQGDAVWATGWWGSFGSNNGNGGRNEEMFLATDADRAISIRVQVSALADTGAYTLSVESCTLHPIPDGVDLTGIDVTTGCSVLGYATPALRMSFFSFLADTLHTYHAIATSTAGTGTLYGKVAGTDLDVGCYTESCTWSGAVAGVTNFDLDLSSDISVPGRQTLLVGVNADSTATVTVSTTSTPKPAPGTSPSFRRAPARRPR